MNDPDPTLLGGTLADLLENQTRLEAAYREAVAEKAGCDQAVKDAESADLARLATALRNDADDPRDDLLPAAMEAKRLADREADVARIATYQNASAISDEARKAAYVDRLAKDEAAATKLALAHLEKLDAALDKVQTCRAHTQWLASPLSAAGTQVRQPYAPDVFVHATSVAKANGEAPMARDLTTAVKEALLDGTPRGDVAPWGIPVGAIKPDNVMSSGAARAFAEQLPEASEAQELLTR